MSFKIYLESLVGEKDTGRVVDILKSRVERKTGMKIYTTTVLDIVLKGGVKTYGIFLMFADGNHAMRLNWSSSDTSASIESIDFWVHTAKHPQYSINTTEMNIVEIVDTIDDVIKGIKSDKKEITEDVILEAAGRTFKDVKELFNSKGYSIEKDPAFTVRRYIITKKSNKEQTPIRFIPVMDEMYDELKSIGAEAFIAKYNAGGKQSGSKSGMVRPAVVETEIVLKERGKFDAMFEDPFTEAELFGLLENGINDVKTGKSKTLLVSGDSGVGKTFTVVKQLAGSNFESFKGGLTSAAALYKMLFINNEKGKILIFDDLDVLMEDKDCVNILKGALESSNNAEVSYISNNTVHPTYYKVLTGELDETNPTVIADLNKLKIDIEGMSGKRLDGMKMRAMDPYSQAAILPNKFPFQAKVIFISNKYLDEIPSTILGRAGTKVEVNLTLAEIVNRIETLLDKLDIPVEEGTPPITMKDKKAAIKYCKEVLIPYGKIKKINFRDFFDICKRASGDAPEALWRKWCSVSLNEAYGEKESTIKRKKR